MKTNTEILALPIERKLELARLLIDNGLKEDAELLLCNKKVSDAGLKVLLQDINKIIPLEAIREIVKRHKGKR